MILSPGSTAFILERRSHAQARGAEIMGRVLGYAMTSDNSPLSGFDSESRSWIDSLESAVQMAGGVNIDCYGAGSYGLPVLDTKETELMKTVLPETAGCSRCEAHRISFRISGMLRTFRLSVFPERKQDAG